MMMMMMIYDDNNNNNNLIYKAPNDRNNGNIRGAASSAMQYPD